MPGHLWCWTLVLLLVSPGPKAQKTEPKAGPSGTLFRGAAQYNFAILLPGSGLQCYWHFAHQSGRFYLTYMVQWVSGMSADRRLHVAVLSPEGIQVATLDEPSGQINFQTQVTGFYQMCFGNFINKFANMQVYLDFGVYYEDLRDVDSEDEEARKDEEQLNSTITNIQVSTDKLKTYVVHMWRFYNYGRMKRATDYYLLVSNSSYVSWWSAAQTVVILTAGYLQLFIIKRLLHSQSSMPRC
ncbi:transmembrane emp24 domain-containing protein 6-like [Alosa sapidissima]|uniref:transmembrane emp24 domain-containing protein 6-like n=1 Tax=Alosa sapidissima TaxID=34773 RepID=UPI001C08495A|nr:transmembrane emp24 domain-containing protein 6-like [Alosa sapidissima]